MSEAKPFCISKKEVWEAYKRVKANKGAAGVDDQSIEDFEKKLKKNLYKIWNRMSSGSYFPPPVRTVKIPKRNGGERKLGIPTVADRIAQQVVKARLEPEVDPLFHADSYGYRPGKSALDAVGQARERCWRYDWVLDLDIKGFFDRHLSRKLCSSLRCSPFFGQECSLLTAVSDFDQRRRFPQALVSFFFCPSLIFCLSSFL